MSLKSIWYWLFSTSFYRLMLLKEGKVIDILETPIDEKSFIYDKSRKTAYVIAGKKSVISKGRCSMCFADIENAIAYTISSEIPKELEDEQNLARLKGNEVSFKNVIHKALCGDNIAKYTNISSTVWLTFIPSTLLGKWLSGDTLDMLMEAPKKKEVIPNLIFWLLIGGGIIVGLYLLFGR